MLKRRMDDSTALGLAAALVCGETAFKLSGVSFERQGSYYP